MPTICDHVAIELVELTQRQAHRHGRRVRRLAHCRYVGHTQQHELSVSGEQDEMNVSQSPYGKYCSYSRVSQ